MLSLPAVLVFYCCCIKLSQMRWLKGPQMYCLTFLEVRSLKYPCRTIVRVSTVLCSSGRPSVGSDSLLASASSGCMTQGPFIFRSCRVEPLCCHLPFCLSSASLFQSYGPGDSTGLAQIVQNHLLS